MLHPPARSGHGHHAEGDGAPLLLPGQEGDGVRGTSGSRVNLRIYMAWNFGSLNFCCWCPLGCVSYQEVSDSVCDRIPLNVLAAHMYIYIYICIFYI